MLTNYKRSKSIYCIHFLGSWRGFSVITAPKLNAFGWNLEYMWALANGGIVPSVQPNGAKTCFFSVIKATLPFGHLSYIDFDHVWNNRSESVQGRTLVRNFRISVYYGFCKPRKPAPEAIIWEGSFLSAYSENGAVSGNMYHFKG